MRTLLWILLFASGCACGRAEASSEISDSIHMVMIELQRSAVALPSEPDQPPRTHRRALPRKDTPRDGYEDAKRWCEPPVLRACVEHSDCADLRTPTGASLKCARPYWAKDDTTRVCAAKWPSRREREWREARLLEIVSEICSGSKCSEGQLGAFLTTVAMRESTLRPWKVHRLNGDVRANRLAWELKAERYGHERGVARKKVKGKLREVSAGVQLTRSGNRYYADDQRWQGYGLFGQNSPLFVYLWDPAAPPEVLCREVEAVATYTARAKIAATKQRNLGIAPTWATVHAALAVGEVRPSQGAIDRFRVQARRAGLDADQPVTPESFGRSLGETVGARRLAAELVRAVVDERHPWPPRAPGA